MEQALTSDCISQGIRIQTSGRYLPDRSHANDGEYLFTYHIIISNEGKEPAKLLSRHWIIINADGEHQDVKGPGVVGETPTLKQGDTFEYDSFCPLNTSWGTMEGSYQMQRPSGEVFDATIGRFFLVMPELSQKKVAENISLS